MNSYKCAGEIYEQRLAIGVYLLLPPPVCDMSSADHRGCGQVIGRVTPGEKGSDCQKGTEKESD